MEAPFNYLHKGTSVLLNVFHRADTNGDGLVAKEEFLEFFWDGILTEDELTEIFEEVDIHHTGSVSSSDLCQFMWVHMGEFGGSLAALEDLNQGITQALTSLEKTHGQDSVQTQFVSRFLVRELQHQMDNFHGELAAGAAKMDEQTIPLIDNPAITEPSPLALATASLSAFKKRFPIGPRVRPVRLKRQMVTQTSLHLEDATQDLEMQVKKLERLIRQLENQPILKKPVEMECTEENLLLLVQQRLPVEESCIEQMKESITEYAEAEKEPDACWHICSRWIPEECTFVLYQIWEQASEWNTHVRSQPFRQFQHRNLDCLRQPESLMIMEIPGTWWQND